jgi:hypothetical protein
MTMRRSALMLLFPLLAAAPLTAQGFEGTVMVKPTADGTMPTTWMIKGQRIAVDAAMPASAGPMAGTATHIIVDFGSQSVTVLVPLTPAMSGMMGAMLPPGTKGLKMATALPKGTAAAGTAKKLGTSQTIASLKCDDYEGTSTDGKVERVCMTHDLGEFAYPGGGMGGRGGRGSGPGWVEVMRQVGGFPLKEWTPAGTVDFEVLSVQRGSIPASVFEVPEGYNTMGGMGGRGGF